jgi:hypothetical protein
MTTKDQPQQVKERLMRGKDWIACALVALAVAVSNASIYHRDLDLGGYLGTFVGIVLIWLIGRVIYRARTKKGNVA